jgi:hypothetical protein
LPGANEVAGHFDVGFRWRRVSRWVVVLCGAPVYVQCMDKKPLLEAVLPRFHDCIASHNYNLASHDKTSSFFCQELRAVAFFGISFSTD